MHQGRLATNKVKGKEHEVNFKRLTDAENAYLYRIVSQCVDVFDIRQL